MSQKVVTVLVLMGAMLWTAESLAAPIPYYNSRYWGRIVASDPNDTIEDFIDRSSPPVHDEVWIDNATALAEVPWNDGSTMRAWTVAFPLQADHTEGYAFSIIHGYFDFIATFPKIRIQYTYEILANGLSNQGDAAAYAKISTELRDMTAGGTSVWSFNESRLVEGNGHEVLYGSVDVLLDLVAGHDYYLHLHPEALSRGTLYSEGYAYGRMDHIQVEAVVPLPASSVLLTTGLVGLLGFRRWRRS